MTDNHRSSNSGDIEESDGSGRSKKQDECPEHCLGHARIHRRTLSYNMNLMLDAQRQA